MPLQDLTYRQVADLCRFFEPSAMRVWVFRHARDLKHVVVKILAGIQGDEDNTNVFIYCDAPFLTSEQYAGRVLECLEAELEELIEAFAEAGVLVPAPVPRSGSAVGRLARRVDAVAGAFPDLAGSLVLVLDPMDVGDEARLAATLSELAKASRSPRSKFLLLGTGQSAALARLRDAGPECGGQDFRLSPEAIERQVEADLAGGALSPKNRRKYLAMAGAFAFANGKLDRATEIQVEVATHAEQHGTPADIAAAHFALGGTHLKAKRPAEAEACLVRAAAACLDSGNDTLLAMVLLNLGVALHRQGKHQQAADGFDAGRRAFRALNHPAGEVHALDTKAAALAEARQPDAAEAAWLEALGVADGMADPDVGQGCREGVLDKLGRHYEVTGQRDKLSRLSEAAA